jgi:hypothetical protein
MNDDPIFNNNYYTAQGINSVYDNPVYDRPVPRSSKLERESVEMQVQPLPDDRRVVRKEHMWTLSSEHMSEPAIKSWMQFLAMANNAHTIATTIRADSKEYAFQTDFLKYIKWLPVYRNDVTGELQDVAYEHLAKTTAYNANKARKAEGLKEALKGILAITDRKHVAWFAAHAALSAYDIDSDYDPASFVGVEAVPVTKPTDGSTRLADVTSGKHMRIVNDHACPSKPPGVTLTE